MIKTGGSPPVTRKWVHTFVKGTINLQLKQKLRLSVELEDDFYSWLSTDFLLSLAKMTIFSWDTMQILCMVSQSYINVPQAGWASDRRHYVVTPLHTALILKDGKEKIQRSGKNVNKSPSPPSENVSSPRLLGSKCPPVSKKLSNWKGPEQGEPCVESGRESQENCMEKMHNTNNWMWKKRKTF